METEAVAGAVGESGEATVGEDAQRRSIDAVDALLDEVEQALARLDDGSYGRCEQCGGPIADERLLELAIARACGSCAGIGTPEPTPESSAWSDSEPARQVADDNADDSVDHVTADSADGITHDIADDPFAD